MDRKKLPPLVTNILYIATPTSIHDINWMSFFSSQKEKYKVYVLSDDHTVKDFAPVKERLKAYGIELLPLVHAFSIRSPLQTLSSGRKIRTYISRYNIDLVHFLFATPFALWGNFIDIPYIITTRGSDVLRVLPALLEGKGLKGAYGKFLLKLFKNSFHKAKAITSTSIAQSDKIKELFDISDIEIIRTGVYVNKIAACKDPALLDHHLAGKKFIFSPRYMGALYNIKLQVDAIEQLPRAVLENYAFVFIRGQNFEPEYYKAMVIKLEDLRSRLNITYLIKDYLNQNELWTYYNLAALTVMTPISDGTPNSALEAMAARCPLIMPNLPYDKYIFENACFVLEENDPAALAHLIEKALMAYPAELLDKAYQRVSERGNREIEMEKLQKLYEQIT